MKINVGVYRVLIVASILVGLVSCGGSEAESPVVMPVPELVKPNVIVIFTDDQGYADLGVQGQISDIKTPNIDKLAHNGVRFTHGYITAPQCTPSRAAMHTGQYQQRFGVDENRFAPIPKDVKTLGDRFQKLGYKTGMVGKWHLELAGNSTDWASKNYPEMKPFNVNLVPMEERQEYFPDKRGYDDTFFGFTVKYWRNFDLDGTTTDTGYINTWRDRLDLVSDMAVSFINRHHEEPFYLHVSHYGPHVPLAAAKEYLSRFPGEMPERRRYALAMLAAIDDGVGKIVDTLEQYQLLDNTIIYFISDNGAPLGDDMNDAPIDDHGEAWDGSINAPFIGEKGMLTEGGIRVPYIVQWQGHFDGGLVIDKPVSSLDAAYTALKLAGDTDLASLDGVDLVPAISGQADYLDSRPLFWRFYSQRAIRLGKWKYLQAGIAREYLFDMESESHETVNLIAVYPEIAEELRQRYKNWSAEMLREDKYREIEKPFQNRYDLYLPPN
jgi:arylsulfatase A-like enzyme